MEWLADGICKTGNLSKFAEINEVLAFKPWILSVKHVERLLEKDESGFSWSLEQVCLAVCVMSSYHALCSFVLGQGLLEDNSRVLEQLDSAKKRPELAEKHKDSQSDIDNFYLKYMKEAKERENASSEESSQDEAQEADEEEEEQKESSLR